MAKEPRIDWSRCPLIETNIHVHGGAPVLRSTRMPVSAIVDNFEYGLTASEISDQFEISQDLVEAILDYAMSHSVAHPV
ncbi:MAG: DUF433 domain-containing protein [Candidatus Solibacter usitatus]|nr:DUF433 domain-containing protein [Candidatus Solibacter usitatus]